MVNSYTKIEKGGNLYRSYPFFHKKGCLYDWAYYQWHGFDKHIAARIIRIDDLWDYDIIHNMDQDPHTLPNDADQQIIPHLIKDKWVMVLTAESPQAEQH